MDTTLIDIYMQNLSSKRREMLLDIMEYIQSQVENAVVSSVFTLPGFTIDFLPICNIRVKRDKITVRFFQKDVFAVFADRLAPAECGRCSITVSDTNDFKTPAVNELLKLTAASAKVDAAFIKSIQMRDYGYYNSELLTPLKDSEDLWTDM